MVPSNVSASSGVSVTTAEGLAATMRVDKDVAARFIKHAIAGNPKQAPECATPQASTSKSIPEVGVTTRFSAFAQPPAPIPSDSDEDLQVHTSAPSTAVSSRAPSPPQAEGSTGTKSPKKKKKSKTDPLSGEHLAFLSRLLADCVTRL